jgi:hypothetical protein
MDINKKKKKKSNHIFYIYFLFSSIPPPISNKSITRIYLNSLILEKKWKAEETQSLFFAIVDLF